MDVDVILAQVLRLAASLDDAIERREGCDEDAVYALSGLVLELDAWFVMGGRAPTRWAACAGLPAQAAPFVLTAAPANAPPPRRRHAPVRRRASSRAQLALPFAG